MSIRLARKALAASAITLALVIVVTLAIRRVGESPNFPDGLDWRKAFAGIRPLLPQTGWAAVKVWAFWGWGTAVIAGLLLKIDPAVEVCDALLGGATGLWACAFVLGTIVGPWGLFQAPLFWVLLGAGTLWLARHRPTIALRGLSDGQKLALLGCVLFAIITVPVQLASPVIPYRDALAWAASAQRIVTFHRYAPFDNDPYGLWPPAEQAPGIALFWAMLTSGSHSAPAVLAESAVMVAMGGLVMFGTFRMGQTMVGDTSAGVATLLLLISGFPRLVQSVRPTAIDFALIGAGLGFFLDRRRIRVLIALGALLLGTAVASHPVEGAMGIAVAGGGILSWLLAGDRSGFRAGLTCLLGALLVAAPEFPIALNRPVADTFLALSQLGGIGIIIFGASAIPYGSAPSRRSLRSAGLAAMVIFLSLAFWSLRSELEFIPVLLILAGLGSIVMFARVWIDYDAVPMAGLTAFALFSYPAVLAVRAWLRPHFAGQVTQVMLDLLTDKVHFSCRHFLVLLAAAPFALLYDRWSKAVALLAVLTLLVYPWTVKNSPEKQWVWFSEGHSIVEHLAYNLTIAANGYWQGAPDHHWLCGPQQFDLIDFLNREVRAGRIGPGTRIAHFAFGSTRDDYAPSALFTGINEDPVEYSYNPDDFYHWGSRVVGVDKMGEVMARKPPYILDQIFTVMGGEPFADYEEIFHEGDLRLLRRRESQLKGEPP
jgi:hypothetical protein